MFQEVSTATQAIVLDLPTNPTTGTITVAISGQQGNSQNPLAATLSGSGSGWTTDAQGLQITATGYYQLTFELAAGSGFTLLGIQIYFLDTNQPNTENAALFFPAPSGAAVVHLLHNVQTGASVFYQMFIGLQNQNGIFWPDPTIAFDPQGT